MQTTSIIAVDEPVIVENIKAVIDPPIAKTAPAFICVLTQRINAYRDKCYAVQDYSAAIENMLLAIVELGYQSCWYEGHITDDDRICDKIAEILKVPNGYDLVCILPIGKAKSEVSSPKKKDFKDRHGLIRFVCKSIYYEFLFLEPRSDIGEKERCRKNNKYRAANIL